jgi:hypothetical protein
LDALSLNELFEGIDATQLQNGIADRSLYQYG